MSHTSGPWTLNENAIEIPDRFNSGMTTALAHVYDERDIALDPAEIRANARIIAAAPELLEALKDAVLLIESYKTARHSNILLNAKAAIAKAEGK